MKLWIDDERAAPMGWTPVKSSTDALYWIQIYWPIIDEISFDHDLGGDDTTRRVVLWLCENEEKWPAVCRVHTANPVGREWLEGTINRYGPGVTR